jgi:hypothetical protein
MDADQKGDHPHLNPTWNPVRKDGTKLDLHRVIRVGCAILQGNADSITAIAVIYLTRQRTQNPGALSTPTRAFLFILTNGTLLFSSPLPAPFRH